MRCILHIADASAHTMYLIRGRQQGSQLFFLLLVMESKLQVVGSLRRSEQNPPKGNSGFSMDTRRKRLYWRYWWIADTAAYMFSDHGKVKRDRVEEISKQRRKLPSEQPSRIKHVVDISVTRALYVAG